MTLFSDDELPPATPVAPPRSADSKRTARQQALLAAGTHPATRLALREEPGSTCGTCAHHQAHRWGNRTYHKCHLRPITHGPASDIRVGWPGCVRWEPHL